MIFTLPTAWPGVLAIAAGRLGRLGLKRDRLETLFHAGQVGACVAVGALLFRGLDDRSWLGATVGGVGSIGALLLVVLVYYLANTTLVSIAASLHAGGGLGRTWLHNLTADLSTAATIASLGIVAALLAVDEPLTLPLLAMPVVFVHQALRNMARLRTDTYGALAHLVEVVELRDPYTAGHSRRVANLARHLALQLGLTAEEAEVVASAGEVHDVGKVALDPRVLEKTGPLTPDEAARMRQHPVHGAAVVAHFAAYGDGHRFVRHHHERWDGAGYPDGLAGEAIPLGARIVAVADAFDAMTSRRPYRDPMTPAAALQVCREDADRQWDARVVGALLVWAAGAGIALPRPGPESPAADRLVVERGSDTALPPSIAPSLDESQPGAA
jgi:HD-GYP domain-containing protein (c-di-GMP phosphodiesterase class II)